MTLEGKEIWIISPESWGVSLFSKHYYALALAERGNKVLFLQPDKPDSNPHPNITLAQDTSYIKGTNRLPRFIAERIHRYQMRNLMKKHQSKPDFVWVFDDSQRKYFNAFQPAIVIYHLMDKRAGKHKAISASQAHLCIGVTAGIVNELRLYNPNTHFIPHGYVDYADSGKKLPIVKERYKAGYVGNLLLPYIHWPSIIETIHQNTEVHFFFIGSTGGGNLNPTSETSSSAPLELLRKTSNVTLLGEMAPNHVQTLLQQCDILFYSLLFPKNWGPIEDAHKILTYLGTAKPIVGTSLSAYQDTKDLIYFAASNERLNDRVKEVLGNLEELTTPNLLEKRRGFALNHLYSEHIKRIEAILSK